MNQYYCTQWLEQTGWLSYPYERMATNPRGRILGDLLQQTDDWLKNKGVNTDSLKSGFEYGRDLSLGLVDKERHSVLEPPGKEFSYMGPEEKAELS